MLTRVSEITGMEESVITMQDIFVWKQTGMSDNAVIGTHVSTGVRPEFMKKIERIGIEINNRIFDANYKHTYIIKSSTQNENIIRHKSPIVEKKDTQNIEAVRKSMVSRSEQEADILRRLQSKNGRRFDT